MTPILSLEKASLAFDDKVIWQDLDFQVEPGEFIALIGANGSGKSMLLKSILGQQQLTSGSVSFLGKKAASGSTDIGYIPQHRALDSHLPLRVFDAVRLGLDGHRFGIPISTAKTEATVMEALAKVDATEMANTPLGELSGGEMQRVRVAQADWKAKASSGRRTTERSGFAPPASCQWPDRRSGQEGGCCCDFCHARPQPNF